LLYNQLILINKIDIIFLCGGKGTRLRPYTKNLPKPLLLVNKKPFLSHLINKVIKLRNVDKIILAGGFKVQKIRDFVKKEFKNNKKIIVINSGEVDIIKRIQDASKNITNDFMVCYGDTFVDINLYKYIYKFNKTSNFSYVVGSMYQIKYGTIKYINKKMVVKNFKEKPIIKDPINLGYFLFNKEILIKIMKFKKWVNFLETLAKSKKLKILITNKKYFSFDNPTEYKAIKNKI